MTLTDKILIFMIIENILISWCWYKFHSKRYDKVDAESLAAKAFWEKLAGTLERTLKEYEVQVLIHKIINNEHMLVTMTTKQFEKVQSILLTPEAKEHL